jgi:hypothetical protein
MPAVEIVQVIGGAKLRFTTAGRDGLNHRHLVDLLAFNGNWRWRAKTSIFAKARWLRTS